MPDKNHLFIGLGGFGGKTLAEIRKYAHLCKDRLEEAPQNAPNIEYLYVDSSDDVYEDRALWRILGKDVRIEPADMVPIKEGGIGNALDQIDLKPHVAKWTGPAETLRARFMGLGNEVGANQRRRFGRFLFCSNAPDFLRKATDKISGLGEYAECTIHIFATLAGGTGSGSLIDAITILRKRFGDEGKYKIFVYCYITSRDEPDSNIGGLFYANQYAALKDLNALAIGKYRPQLLSSNREERIPDASYINLVSLITPVNRANKEFSPEKQVKATAQWVYQRALASAAGLIPSGAKKAFTGEDILSGSDAFERDRTTGDERARSNCFSSIGIKRWRIPEEEIQEAFMLDYLDQVLSQAIYNRWDHKNGYIPEHSDSPIGPDDLLNAIALSSSEAWRLSKEEGCRTFQQDWEAESRAVAFSDNLTDSITRLARHLQDYANSNFRNAGIEAYFGARKNGIDQDVEQALRNLSSWMSDQWKEGKVGLLQLIDTLSSLLGTLEANGSQFTKDATAEKIQPTSVIQKWSARSEKIGWLAKLFGAEKKMYKRFALEMANSYLGQTNKHAFSYASLLAERLRSAVNQLNDSLTRTRTHLEDLKTDIANDREPLLDHNAMSADNDEFVFEPDHYSQFWATMRIDTNNLENLTLACRTCLLSDNKYNALETLHGRPSQSIRGALESAAESYIKVGHNAAQTNPQLSGLALLGRRILDLFENDEDQDLEDDVKEFVASAVTLAERPRSESTPYELDPDFSNESLPRNSLLIFYPTTGGSTTAGENLRRLFKAKSQNSTPYFIDHGDPADLLCFSIDVGMPARMLKVVHDLKDRYSKTITNDEKRYFCHLDFEAESGESHPDLLATSRQES